MARKKPAPRKKKPARPKKRAASARRKVARAARRAEPAPPQDPTLHTRPLEPGDWPLIARLFGEKGACGGCWCMYWRVEQGGKSWEAAKGSKNRDRFRKMVQAGQVHGVLAMSGAEPVGWCSFGPRGAFPRLGTVRALQQVAFDEGTWSVVCFYVPARWRGRGVAELLLSAATRRAIALGATRVEGYPADPRKKTLPAAFAWTGVPRLFEKVGYRRLPLARGQRPVFVAEPS